MTNKEIVGAFVEDSKDYNKPKKTYALTTHQRR